MNLLVLGYKWVLPFKMLMLAESYKLLVLMFHELSWFWIIAPLMGLIVQPIIGHYSDNTWGRFGEENHSF
jgi:hypothetical protein